MKKKKKLRFSNDNSVVSGLVAVSGHSGVVLVSVNSGLDHDTKKRGIYVTLNVSVGFVQPSLGFIENDFKKVNCSCPNKNILFVQRRITNLYEEAKVKRQLK